MLSFVSRFTAAAFLFVVGNVGHAQTVCDIDTTVKPGVSGHQTFRIDVPGKDIEVAFHLHEPTEISCGVSGVGKHPLLLHGPGFSSAGNSGDNSFRNYRDDGYAVISWDPLGFGESGGTARVMDPEFEGEAFVAILDWAETTLDYLSWRDESTGEFVARPIDMMSVANGVNLVVGSIGGSYGGMYQFMALLGDEKKRLDSLAPQITPHDLRHALNPGDVVKTAWDLLLSAAGEAQGNATNMFERLPLVEDGLDPFIKETLARGAALGEFPRQALDFFHYRSISYWCSAHGLPSMPYVDYGDDIVPMIDATMSDNTPDRNENGTLALGEFLIDETADPTEAFSDVRFLIRQGMVDTLFNYNDAWYNAACMRAAGADVTLTTYNSGHVLPTADFLDGNGSDQGSCPYPEKAWLDADLRPGAEDVDLGQTCFALGTNGDDAFLNFEDVLAPGSSSRYVMRSIPDSDSEFGAVPGVVVPNGAFGVPTVVGSEPTVVSFGEFSAEAVLAGIPVLNITVATPLGLNDATNETLRECQTGTIPTRAGCDTVTFVGVGKRAAGADDFLLVDNQIQPVRGLGSHRVEMVGVAERFQAGDEIALLFYSYHSQYFSSVSREATIPAVNIHGDAAFPLYAVDSDGQPAPKDWADELIPGGQPAPLDEDADGVPDNLDQCPGTAAGAAVDSDGCATSSEPDADGDGVPDSSDICPSTESGRVVDQQGCPASNGAVTVNTFTVEPSFIDVSNGPVDVTLRVDAETSDPFGGDLSYVYYFGDGQNSGVTDQNAWVRAYDKAGNYTVSVVVVDENQNSSTEDAVLRAVTTVVVEEDPVDIIAILDVDPKSGVAPLTVSADASGSTFPEGAIFEFDFGDGTIVRGQRQRVSHVYSVDGTYTVDVTVSSGEDADTASESVIVGSPQQTTALLRVPNPRVNIGEPVQFDARESVQVVSDPITVFLFDFGNGDTARREVGDEPGQFSFEEAAFVTYAYSTAGTYNVSVTVNPDSTKSTASTRVTVSTLQSEDGNGQAPVESPPQATRSSASGALGWPLLLLFVVGLIRRRG